MTKVNLEQTDIFSMFDIVDEVAEQKKREDEERRQKAEALRKKMDLAKQASPTTPSATPASKPEPEKFDVNEDTVIRHYGESIEITSYFTTEELAEGLLVKKKEGEDERKPLDGEMLRKRMEKDYPEMVKEHTEVVFLKSKNLVIVTQKAKKKGSDCMEESLSYDSGSSFSAFPFPRIPFTVLRDFVAVARFYGEVELEIHADIYLQDGKYFLDFPQQYVNQYWVQVIESSEDIIKRVEDAVKVLEIHSHHNMQSIPSSQDNQSERVPGRYYAIVGNTHKFFPDITARKYISNEYGYRNLEPEEIFENPFHKIPAFKENAIEVCL
ncbi:hypothetical protein ACVBAX_21345 [Robertmurraya sp. GLU-23]